MPDLSATPDLSFLLGVFVELLRAFTQVGLSVQEGMQGIGQSAVPGWALQSTDTGSPYLSAVHKFIQLLGLIGVLKGARGIMLYFSPEHHPKKPPNLGAPGFMLLIGMMAMVPNTVYLMALDFFQRLGWA